MALRRGFKTEANWYSREFRRELGLAPQSPLCAWRLAGHLDIPITPLSEYLNAIPDHVRYLSSPAGQADFSAITICYSQRRLIIHNDAHSQKRQAANIVHELSHAILHHPPKPPFNEQGSRHYDRDLEDEANWLGPALLISEEAALHIVRRGMSVEEASDYYTASAPLVRMRLSVTGAYRRAAARAA